MPNFVLALGLACVLGGRLSAQPVIAQTEALGYDVALLDRHYQDHQRVALRVEMSAADSTGSGVRLRPLERVIEDLWNGFDSLGAFGLHESPLSVRFDVAYGKASDVDFEWPPGTERLDAPRYAHAVDLAEAVVHEGLDRLWFRLADARARPTAKSVRLSIWATPRVPPPPIAD